MPIPVMQFQPETFAQANPALQGIGAGVSLIDQLEKIKQQQVQTKMLPLTAMGQYLGGLGKASQAQSYASPERQFGRILNTPALMSLMGSNPKVARYVANALAGMSQRLGGKLRPNEGELTVNPAAGGAGSLTNLPHPLNTNLQNNVAGIGTGAPVTDQDVQDMQSNMRDVLTRKMLTAQIINQKQYASVLDNLFDYGNKQIGSVSRYAGLLGKASGSLQAVKSMLGNTSNDYATYLYFTRHTLPATINEMRRTLGGQASDKEIALMDKVGDPLFWDSNPSLAVGSWNDLQNLYKRAVGPAIAGRISETTRKLQQRGREAPLPTQLSQIRKTRAAAIPHSQADLEFTAKKYGMTIAQVKQRLGVQ